jgi:hypothetical protein
MLVLQPLGRALMLPIAVLPVAAHRRSSTIWGCSSRSASRPDSRATEMAPPALRGSSAIS